MLAPDRIHPHSEICSGHGGIGAVFQRRADVTVTPKNAHLRITKIPRNAAANCDRKAEFDQRWRLLDMNFQKGANAEWI